MNTIDGRKPAQAVMTLRDYFAAQALPALIAVVSAQQHMPPAIATTPLEGIAIDAYMLADAMLNARMT